MTVPPEVVHEQAVRSNYRTLPGIAANFLCRACGLVRPKSEYDGGLWVTHGGGREHCLVCTRHRSGEDNQ